MRKTTICLLAAAVAVCLAGPTVLASHSEHHCADCHQPHRAFDPNDNPDDWGVPLFNSVNLQDQPLPAYKKYASKTFDALGLTYDGQPNGSSRLCLGCHDGTYSRVTSDHTFGVDDLANSHPISVDYEEARAAGADLKDPANLSGYGSTVAVDMLDEKNNVQCVSCHDIHKQGGEQSLKGGELWDGRGIKLCTSCHDK